MAERSRTFLENQIFFNGARPDQTGFADLADSFLHKSEDGITLDGNGYINFEDGIKIGFIADADGEEGFLRYNPGSQSLQLHTGSGFEDIGTGDEGGGFTPVSPGSDHIDFNGLNVGIGTGPGDPQFKLDVAINAQADPNNSDNNNQVRFGTSVISRGAGTQGQSACFGHENFATNNGYALKHSAQGLLELNTSGTSAANQEIRFNINGAPVARITSDPNQRLFVTGNVRAACGILSCSDARFKEKVHTLDSSLEKITALNGVSFQWKQKEFPAMGFPANKQFGFIAQEVEKVLPELVSTDQEGEKAIDYSRLSPLLVEAVKELALEKQQLSEELDDLQQQFKVLQDKMNEILTANG